MRFLRFLKYERPYLLLYAAVFLLTAAVFATDTRSAAGWQTFFYAASLAALALAAFVVHRYLKQVQASRLNRADETEPLSLEAEAFRDALETLRIEHIRDLNEVQAKQKEYYDFILSWFHEIKTPISVVRLMQQTEVDPRSLEEEITRIEHYVDQALYYAKLDNFNQDYEIVNCNLQQIAKDAVKAHAKAFISRKVRVQLDVSAAIVQSDPKWLAFIVSQLLSNSLKYTGEQGEISISALVTQEEKRLIIRDNGIGINAMDLPRIFNRGFTGTNGRKHAKSTGMGLYLAQELSRKLGHYLTCESVLGSYTAFTIHFPKNADPHLQTVRRR